MTGTAGSLLNSPSAGASIELRGPKLEIKNGRIAGINLSGGDAGISLGQEGGDGGQLFAGSLSNPLTDTIEIELPIVATTGANSLVVNHGGVGGIVNLTTDGDVKVKSTIKVSDSASGRASKSGGVIRLESLGAGKAIKVENSSQLLSLLAATAPSAGGGIHLLAPSGSIEVKDSTIQADRGTVEFRAGGSGGVIFENATVRGGVVKAEAYGNDGRLVIKGNTSITADTTLKLYASGSNGEVLFNDSTTLGGASAKYIAGKTVSISSGKVVTVNGNAPAQVFTDRGNYTGSGGNGSSSGKFGGKGATTQPFSKRPAF